MDEDYSFLNLPLSGRWKFQTGDNKEWATVSFDDQGWPEINVPDVWENQGYNDYDGYAWYRKEFELPSDLVGKQLYLSMGKIDDYDYVYLNGILIGNIFGLKKDHDYRYKGFEFNARRVYKIPTEILKTNQKNLIAVRVFDKGGLGGIWEGPVGIMDASNYKEYHNKYYEPQNIWDSFIDEFFNWKD